MLALQISEDHVQHTVRILHYAYPVALLLWFVGAQCAAACTLANLRAQLKPYRRSMFIWMQLAVIACYVLEAGVLITRSAIRPNWWCGEHNVLYLIPSILMWSIFEMFLLENPRPVWFPYFGCWALATAAEFIFFITRVAYLETSEPFDVARLWVQVLRLLVLGSLPVLSWALNGRDTKSLADMEERSALLGTAADPQNSGSYGSIAPSDGDYEDPYNDSEQKAQMLERMEKSGNWLAYAKSFKMFLPYVWPSRDRYLQLCMSLVGVCLLLERCIQVLVPYQMGVVVDSLTKNSSHAPWKEVSLLILYRWLNSGSGISWAKNYLWIPVEQYSYREITTAAYNHVMSLSYDFHSNKKTGEIWATVSQGRSVSDLVQLILFSVAPMVADMLIAFGYFLIFFNAYMALIVAVVCVVYLWATAHLSSLKNRVRREMNAAMRNESHVMMESMSSWSTVSYFNRIDYEQNRYLEAVRRCQIAEKRWTIGISTVVVVQSLIFTVGLLMACFLAIYEVSAGKRPVGSFVTLLSYWAQLNGPLSFFASLYRSVMNKLLDAEKLLTLFQTLPSVVDKPGATELAGINGEIVFDKVSFDYDPRKPIIQDMSFRVPPGSTVALVGETGGGKTTCLRLLFRFYDVKSGSIAIDGHDIRDVTIKSLRDNMGVVPQDPQLFNDTIMNNLKYANFEVSDEQVYAAARAASIHEKILTFPDGYQSKVGERGVRLSGGELQRVAIARAILRNPKIILLDEATSMIDIDTEREIQSAFRELAKDRTMFVIAHRLSTIMNADLIIVIKDGKMIESGNHEQLMTNPHGKYRQLWTKQGKHIQGASGQATSILDEPIVGSSLGSIMIPTGAQHEPSPLPGSYTAEHKNGRAPPDTKKTLCPFPDDDTHNLQHSRSAPGTQRSILKPEAKEFVPRSLSTAFNPPTGMSKVGNFGLIGYHTFPSSTRLVEASSGPKLETTSGRQSRKILAEALSKLKTDHLEPATKSGRESDASSPTIFQNSSSSSVYPSPIESPVVEAAPSAEVLQGSEKKKRHRIRRRSSLIPLPAGHKDNYADKTDEVASNNVQIRDGAGRVMKKASAEGEPKVQHIIGPRLSYEILPSTGPDSRLAIGNKSSNGEHKARGSSKRDYAIKNVTNSDTHAPIQNTQEAGEETEMKTAAPHFSSHGKSFGRKQWHKRSDLKATGSENTPKGIVNT